MKSLEDVNIYDYFYNSNHPLHNRKKIEVALLLIGSFAEDISMYRVRNMDLVDLKGLTNKILSVDLKNG